MSSPPRVYTVRHRARLVSLIALSLFGLSGCFDRAVQAQQSPKPQLDEGESPSPAAAPAASATQPSDQPSKETPAVTKPAAAGDGTPATILDGDRVQGLLGKPVRSSSGEDMGRIVDVIVDRSRVRAAIIDFGGFLGVGSRQIAVDWSALRFPAEGKSEAINVDLTRDQLRVAPAYKAGEQIVLLGRPGANPTPQQQPIPEERGEKDKPR